MKAILLAGGKGTRLRPLTLHTPKPVVPIFNRPFLYYQLDLLRQLPEIDEVILSLNYQPRRIEEALACGPDPGVKLRFVVEPTPLGTAGAVKYAEEHLDDSVMVLNGDILARIDLAAVVHLHRARRAKATIVLTPVANPSAYGLVETDAHGNVRAFIEKPSPDRITCNTINAGIYVLEPETLDRIPKGTAWSIERSFFPSLVERGEVFVAYVAQGYWIDIGTPAKYLQVHRDIMDRRYRVAPFADGPASGVLVAPGARVEEGARLEPPCFVDEGCIVKAGARIGPYAVLGRDCRVREDAVVEDALVWPYGDIDAEAVVRSAVLGRGCVVGRSAVVGPGVVLGDKSVVTDFSRLGDQ